MWPLALSTMGGLIASRPMRASPAPSPVGSRPALNDHQAHGNRDEQRGQDHDQQEGHGHLARCCPWFGLPVCWRNMEQNNTAVATRRFVHGRAPELERGRPQNH